MTPLYCKNRLKEEDYKVLKNFSPYQKCVLPWNRYGSAIIDLNYFYYHVVVIVIPFVPTLPELSVAFAVNV